MQNLLVFFLFERDTGRVGQNEKTVIFYMLPSHQKTGIPLAIAGSMK